MSKELVTEKSSPIEKPFPESLPITLIRRDGGTQPRVAINQTTVEEYASDMKEGASFPPVLLFFDSTDYWLADGYHRVEAALSIGLNEIAAVVRQGNQRDAVLYSCGANATHGLRRTNADKRRAVLTLLQDGEWSQWTNVAIAKACGVAESFVRKLKKESHFAQCDVRTYRTKHGTVATMNTANIGKKAPSPPEELPERVLVQGNHPASGQSGTITQVPNSYSAIVQLDAGGRELIELKYLVWEGTQTPLREKKDFTSVSEELDDQGKRLGLKYNRTSDQVLPDVERNHRSPADVDDRPGAALPPQKVEVHTNDICIAFMSNLDSLSTAHIKAVGKAIAVRAPHLASVMATALAQSSKQAVAIVKALTLIYPEAIRDLIEEINNDKNPLVNDGNPDS